MTLGTSWAVRVTISAIKMFHRKKRQEEVGCTTPIFQGLFFTKNTSPNLINFFSNSILK